MIQLQEAIANQLCRICGKPINHPSSSSWIDDDDYPIRRCSSVTSRNGQEYAHSACVVDPNYVPWMPV